MEILAQLRNLSFGTAAAYSVLLILLVLIISIAARMLGGRPERVETIPTA
jgi:ABC-type sugar transport system permease subunit